MRTTFVKFAVLVAALLVPAAAQAQGPGRPAWFVAPFFGSAGGGDTTVSSPSVGVTGGWMAKKWLGAEADLSWAPEFFEQDGFLSSRKMLTVMGNGIITLPGWRERLQPYSSAGLGLLRPRLSEAGELFAVETNKLGWNVGGGATFAKGNTGLRGDVRYFRGLGESDADNNAFGIDFSRFGFWRVAVGLNVRF